VADEKTGTVLPGPVLKITKKKEETRKIENALACCRALHPFVAVWRVRGVSGDNVNMDQGGNVVPGD